MRKRNIAVLLLTALLLAGLTGCARRGDTSGVEIVVGASEQFSDEDIRGAMDAAMRAFHRGHSGCAMVRLAYNEAYRTCWLAGAGAQDDGNTIVLLASVYARDPGRRSGLTAAMRWKQQLPSRSVQGTAPGREPLYIHPYSKFMQDSESAGSAGRAGPPGCPPGRRPRPAACSPAGRSPRSRQ